MIKKMYYWYKKKLIIKIMTKNLNDLIIISMSINK